MLTVMGAGGVSCQRRRRRVGRRKNGITQFALTRFAESRQSPFASEARRQRKRTLRQPSHDGFEYRETKFGEEDEKKVGEKNNKENRKTANQMTRPYSSIITMSIIIAYQS